MIQKYVTGQIESFLRAVDKHLNSSFEITIIGGAAAALAYKVVNFTKDIDTIENVKAIEQACEMARIETGYAIPIGPARVEQAPYHYIDRIKRLKIHGLRHLRVYVPEIHDRALMKMVRANANDIETIRQMHKRIGLDFELLVERFKSEMKHVIGDPAIVRLNFLGTIESVFGAKATERAELKL